MLKLSFSLMKLPNLQNEGRKVSESFMKFHKLKLSILEVSEPYSGHRTTPNTTCNMQHFELKK